MKLNVPLVRQPKNSQMCCHAGAAMLFSYHNIYKSMEAIKMDLPSGKDGIVTPEFGSYLLEHGFDVTIITMHPQIFTKKDKGLGKGQLIRKFNNITKKAKGENRKAAPEFVKFLKNGGNIQVKIPDEDDIKGEIKQKRPLGVAMTSNFILGKRPTANHHFCLVTGIDNKYVYVNDSLWDNRGGRKRYKKKDFFYGLYANTGYELDFGCLVKIHKR